MQSLFHSCLLSASSLMLKYIYRLTIINKSFSRRTVEDIISTLVILIFFPFSERNCPITILFVSLYQWFFFCWPYKLDLWVVLLFYSWEFQWCLPTILHSILLGEGGCWQQWWLDLINYPVTEESIPYKSKDFIEIGKHLMIFVWHGNCLI